MNRTKTISVVAFLSATIATPVFAQDADTYGPSEGYLGAAPAEPETYYRFHEQVDPSFLPPRNEEEYQNLENFGRTGRDPSRVGGDAPSLKPPS